MRTLHLFAGAGGGLYADLILGHTPVAAVEIAPYQCQILRERAADGWWPGLVVHECDIRDFDPSEYAGRVDAIHAGFPCTDISVAGSGLGIAQGKRSGLWSEVVRCARALRPDLLFLENVPAITARGLDIVLADLAALGFDARWDCVSAAGVGAPHLRERWWCTAWMPDAEGQRWRQGRPQQHPRQRFTQPASVCSPVPNPNGLRQQQPARGEREIRHGPSYLRVDVPDAVGLGLAQWGGGREDDQPWKRQTTAREGWWATEPDVGRVAHGVADRIHRIESLGNGQVPLAAALGFLITSSHLTQEN